MAELTKIGQVIGKEVNSLLSLKLYKQSLVTLCLGYAVGVGGGLSSQKDIFLCEILWFGKAAENWNQIT